MYSYGSPHMAAQKQDDQLERTFSSYVRIQDVVLKTYLRRWTIGRSGERGSGISVLPARYDDDDAVSSIKLIDWALSSASTPGQSGPGSNGNEGVLRIPQSPSITGTSRLDCLVSYPGHSLVYVCVGGLTPLQRCSRGILQPQPIGQIFIRILLTVCALS